MYFFIYIYIYIPTHTHAMLFYYGVGRRVSSLLVTGCRLSINLYDFNLLPVVMQD